MKTNFPWPEGASNAVAVTVNFDAESYDLLSTTPDRLYGRFSYGRYGVRAGLPRLLDVLAKNEVRSTFFVTGVDAQRHANALQRISEAGHEVASRGASMKRPDAAQELTWLRDGIDAVSQATGKPVLGYRSPDNELTPRTLYHLLELGLIYDSTFQDDDAPYRFALSAGKLAEIPISFALGDAQGFSARHSHQRVLQIWRDETEALLAADALIPLTLHLRGDFGSTRAARIAMLDTYFQTLRARSNAPFVTCADLARWTLETVEVPEEGDPYEVHADTLANTVYRGDLAVKPI